MTIQVPAPEYGGPRLHLDLRRCPVCREAVAFVKAWVRDPGGPCIVAHGETEHIVAEWPPR